MKLNLILCLVLSLIVISLQCNKKTNLYSDNGLPPASQTGQDIFACRLNNEPWISMQGLKYLGGGLSNDSLDILGTKRLPDGNLEMLFIKLYGSFSAAGQSYPLDDTLRSYVEYERTGASTCFTVTRGYGGLVKRKVTGGIITITKADPVHQIISGTFSFSIPTDFCDTLKITDGRFDILTTKAK